ncbi:hypothetical protein PAHAL_9G063200 [Panicum hallii]|uniref:Uncharacterized protein n=1 Tax=Panicum hallii TaxID=206008 RepID=A0A2S3IHH2_9POAL|nr:hypothetical protein PAHAL_9G063200 [Panicum hallii]
MRDTHLNTEEYHPPGPRAGTCARASSRPMGTRRGRGFVHAGSRQHLRHGGHGGHLRHRHARHFGHLGHARQLRHRQLRQFRHLGQRRHRHARHLGQRQVGKEAGGVARVSAAAEERGGHDDDERHGEEARDGGHGVDRGAN